MNESLRVSLKFVFALVTAVAAYMALVTAVGLANANGLILFFALVLTPVWVSFGWMFLESNPQLFNQQRRFDRNLRGRRS